MKKSLFKPAILAITVFSLLLTNFPSMNFNVAHADGARYIVSGSDFEAVNGTYVEYGTSAGKPKYEHTSGEITYAIMYTSSNLWFIKDVSDEWHYVYSNSNIDGDIVPLEGWTSNTYSTPTVSLPGLAIDTLSPADDSADIDVDSNLVITFNQNVVAGTGDILIKRGSAIAETIAVTSAQVSIDGAEVTIDPSIILAKDTDYYVLIDEGAFEDESENAFAGITAETTWSFTTASAENLLLNPGAESDFTSWTKVNAGSGWAITSGRTGDKAFIASYFPGTLTQTATFGYAMESSPDIYAKVYAKGVYNVADPYSLTVTLKNESGETMGSPYNISGTGTSDWVRVPIIISGYDVGVKSIDFKLTGDDTEGWAGQYGIALDDAYLNFAPGVSAFTPVDNATDIDSDSNLTIEFDQIVHAVDNKNITIKKTSDNSTVETIATISVKVSGSGTDTITINPSGNFAADEEYYVLIDDGAFVDASMLDYQGVWSTTAWSFTVAMDPAPGISAVTATDITSTGATITWTTDPASSSQVEYALTSELTDSDTTEEEDSETMVTSHSVNLTGLTACTTYYYKVISTAENSEEGESAIEDFTTDGCSSGSSGGSYIKKTDKNKPETSTTGTTSHRFIDTSSHWAKEYIDALYEKNIIRGIDSLHFNPDDFISRAEFVKMVVSSMEYDLVTDTKTPSFTDLNLSDWYLPYIETAKKNGIIDGYENGSFNPNNKIKRSEAVKVLVKAIYKGRLYRFENLFDDVKPADWFAPYIVFASQQNIIKGYKDRSFMPDSFMTRAEAAKIISLIND